MHAFSVRRAKPDGDWPGALQGPGGGKSGVLAVVVPGNNDEQGKKECVSCGNEHGHFLCNA
jgi:hypothetical protein